MQFYKWAESHHGRASFHLPARLVHPRPVPAPPCDPPAQCNAARKNKNAVDHSRRRRGLQAVGPSNILVCGNLHLQSSEGGRASVEETGQLLQFASYAGKYKTTNETLHPHHPLY